MGFKEIVNKMLSKKKRLKEIQQEDRIQTIVEERKKNSNERELEKYYEELRQANIKKELEEFRKKKREDMWHGNNILKGKNIFKGQPSIMKNDFNILGGKKLFTIKSNNLKGGNILR